MCRYPYFLGLVASAALVSGLTGCDDSVTNVDLASADASTTQNDQGATQTGDAADQTDNDTEPPAGDVDSGVDDSADTHGGASDMADDSTDSGGRGSSQSDDGPDDSNSTSEDSDNTGGSDDTANDSDGDENNSADDDDAGASNRQVPFPPKPDDDPFYHQPDSLGDEPRGTILQSRMVQYAPEAGAPMPNDAWQLKFISRDIDGNPIAAIATVVKPEVEPPGGSPLLAYQYAEDGLGIKCAPSHSVTGETDNQVSQAEGASPVPGLKQGWTLVYPDHEGPNSAFAAGPLEGRITLDSIRAAENFEPLGLSASTRVGMWGYSGGAIATAWAATLQNSYAPKLNIVAIASGGTPADVLGIARHVDTDPVANSAFFSLVLSAIVGANRVYPKLVTPLLNDKGRSAARSLANGCTGNTSDGSSRPSGHFEDYVTVDNVFKVDQVRRIAGQISLPQADSSPVADTFVYHSQIDELIPIEGATAMVDDWCGKGATVHYYRGQTGEHAGFQPTTTPFVLAYLKSRFALNAAVVPPGTQDCNSGTL